MNIPIRLQKYLADCGVASRRKSEEIISQGRVTINGVVITEMGKKIIPGQQNIQVDQKDIAPVEKNIYLLLNKPKGYVTTLSDPQGRPIVTSLLKNVAARVFPVGRLDLDTSGALILTNDGQLAQNIQHPSNNISKTYEAIVKGTPSQANIRKLQKGIMLEGRMTARANLRVIKKFTTSTCLNISIHEGRKRQVRKMFQAIGHQVLELKRIAYGQLLLKDLASGKFRHLSTKDLEKIFSNKNPLQKQK